MAVKLVVENAVQAKEEIEKLDTQGYSRDNVYVFAHYKERGDDINEALHTEKAGLKEEGFLDSLKNMFSSRGDELRSKMEGAGLTADEAANAEAELDKGKLIIIANK